MLRLVHVLEQELLRPHRGPAARSQGWPTGFKVFIARLRLLRFGVSHT